MSRAFKVLLVEDDDALRGCLDEFLAMQGLKVAATGHGGEAIELARQQRFDFSIVDFHLPGMTGLDVLRAIQAFHSMPSILMSGLATREETARAMQFGVFTFLRKPLELDRVRQTLDLLILHHFGGGPGPRMNLPR